MTPHHTKTILHLLAAVLLLGTALAGCLTQEAEAASGELYVKDQLTDEAAEVHITFNKAEVLPAGGGQAWETVFEGEQTFEMLGLSGPDDKAKLSDFDLQPGEYLRMRITITNVTVVDHEGNETAYVTYGNVVTIAHGFQVGSGDSFELLVDFDLDNGVDLESQEYIPVIGFAETAHKGHDGTTTEANRTERPEQSNAMNHRGIFGVCTAWTNAEQGRIHGNATNSTAFTWLQDQAAAENQTVDDYCQEQGRPGGPSDLEEILPDQMPEQARQALQDRRLGPPEDPQRAGDRAERGADHRPSGNETGQGQGSGGSGGPPQGNQSGNGQGNTP